MCAPASDGLCYAQRDRSDHYTHSPAFFTKSALSDLENRIGQEGVLLDRGTLHSQTVEGSKQVLKSLATHHEHYVT
jgi:hypothetical protein